MPCSYKKAAAVLLKNLTEVSRGYYRSSFQSKASQVALSHTHVGVSESLLNLIDIMRRVVDSDSEGMAQVVAGEASSDLSGSWYLEMDNEGSAPVPSKHERTCLC
jgi:hypothetical protein